jgi:hypothetical protein
VTLVEKEIFLKRRTLLLILVIFLALLTVPRKAYDLPFPVLELVKCNRVRVRVGEDIRVRVLNEVVGGSHFVLYSSEELVE